MSMSRGTKLQEVYKECAIHTLGGKYFVDHPLTGNISTDSLWEMRKCIDVCHNKFRKKPVKYLSK